MDYFRFGEMEGLNDTDSQIYVKEEPESEISDHSSIDELESEEEIKDEPCKKRKDEELEIEEEIREEHHKKRRKNKKFKYRYSEKTPENGRTKLTQLPYIINIQSSVDFEKPAQNNHSMTFNAQDDKPKSILQSSMSDIAFTSNAYEILLDIQRTLKDLKAEVAENGKKIDQLQKYLPDPCSWNSVKSDFDFPVCTEEQLLVMEKQLENNEVARKLFAHLTSRTYSSWREMILVCLKYMLSRNVAVLYNLYGLKGSKKKFRDLNMCNILIECVKYKYKEMKSRSEKDILARISIILAGAGDWQGSRTKKYSKKIKQKNC